jgi:hypothetical protein
MKNTSSTGVAYACYPAIPRDEGAAVPSPRTRHAACVQGHELAVFGGCDQTHKLVDQDSSLWIWNIESLKWYQVVTDRYAQSSSTSISMLIIPLKARSPYLDTTTSCSITVAISYFTADDHLHRHS